MIRIVYFSPTGNVRYAAEKMAGVLSSEESSLFPLEFTNPEDLQPADHLILMFAIHGFNAPRTVGRFVNDLPENLFDTVSVVAVGCAESWINGAASSAVVAELKRKGYTVVADARLAMPLTFVMKFPEETARSLIDNLVPELEKIAVDIKSGKEFRRSVPMKSKIISAMGRGEGAGARLFGLELHADSTCTSCGHCIRRCPEQNIHFNRKSKPRFGLNCLMCMRCVYECPEQAISPRFAKFIPIKGGYNLKDYLEPVEPPKANPEN